MYVVNEWRHLLIIKSRHEPNLYKDIFWRILNDPVNKYIIANIIKYSSLIIIGNKRHDNKIIYQSPTYYDLFSTILQNNRLYKTHHQDFIDFFFPI